MRPVVLFQTRCSEFEAKVEANGDNFQLQL